MKKLIFILFALVASSPSFAQQKIVIDTSCSFLKNLSFRNGIDTIQVKVVYHDFLEGSDESILKILDEEKKLNFNDYYSQKNGSSSSINFNLLNCDLSYEGTLSRNIYDKTFIKKTKSLNVYVKEIINMNDLRSGQLVYLTCVVFQDKTLIDKLGNYFFTIIDLRL